MPVNFWYNGDLCVKTSSWKFYSDRISSFRDIWGKPDFTPERVLNQADLARDELWRHGVNAAVWETGISYENCSFSCIVLSIYEHFFLLFYFLINPGWLIILLVEFNPYFIEQKCRIRTIVCFMNFVKCVTHFTYKCTPYVAKWQLIKALLL